jgi:1,4-dihydroxy-2-naphthoyl-CoA hydrolase
MGFADTLGAVATVLNMPPKTRTTTIESKTNFFRALRSDGRIVGECTPLHKGKTTMVWQTRIFDERRKARGPGHPDADRDSDLSIPPFEEELGYR